MKVALVACSAGKRERPARARELYTGALLRKSVAYAEHIEADAIYILSAKYGLVRLDEVIAPYDETLNAKSTDEIRAWSERVLAALRARHSLERDEFIILAGERYRRYLLPHLTHVSVPLMGLGIGRQLAWLTRTLEKS